jgi:hypothetical protein
MVFHVERFLKTFAIRRLLLLAIVSILAVSCITQRRTVNIGEYVLLPNGLQTLGHDEGLTAFVFENNPQKPVFAQFVADKYGVGSYEEVSYKVDIDNRRFTVFVYDTALLNKYFDMSQFMVSTIETEPNIVGSAAPFIGLSIVDEHNQDCLTDASLYKNIAITYLTNLKNEYYNL